MPLTNLSSRSCGSRLRSERFDDRREQPSRERFQQATQHRILVAHARNAFLTLANQKDPANLGRTLRAATTIDSSAGQPWAFAGMMTDNRDIMKTGSE